MQGRCVFIAATALIALIMMISLSGCKDAREIVFPVETVEVKVPVIKHAKPTEDMRRTKLDSSELPEWLAPGDPAAAVCLSDDGAKKKRAIDADREGTLDILELWGFSDQ